MFAGALDAGGFCGFGGAGAGGAAVIEPGENLAPVPEAGGTDFVRPRFGDAIDDAGVERQRQARVAGEAAQFIENDAGRVAIEREALGQIGDGHPRGAGGMEGRRIPHGSSGVRIPHRQREECRRCGASGGRERGCCAPSGAGESDQGAQWVTP